MSVVSFLAVFLAFLACVMGLQVDVDAASGGQMSADTAGEDDAASAVASSDQHNATSVLADEHTDDNDDQDDDMDDDKDDDDDDDDDVSDSDNANKFLQKGGKLQKGGSSMMELAAKEKAADPSDESSE